MHSLRFTHARKSFVFTERQFKKRNITYSPIFNNLLSACKSKIIYNEVIHEEEKKREIDQKWKRMEHEKVIKTGILPKAPSMFSSCMVNSIQTEESDKETAPLNFPYRITRKVLSDKNQQIEDEAEPDMKENSSTEIWRSPKRHEFENPKNWDEDNVENVVYDENRFGTADPTIPASNTPCGGCGALLHCTNTSVPGFIPKELFESLSEIELKSILCQRCVFLEEYNVALGMSVNPDEYVEIISKVKHKRCYVILLVDMLDFPCSVLPDINSLIGRHKQVFIVGNKSDLLIKENESYIEHRKKCLVDALCELGLHRSNIRHVSLISAKTGYGVEDLITNISNIWNNAADIYIVGCTNSGKSTLFNCLMQSDLCKVKAADLLQRATISQWPGTTVNLLKFPMLKAVAWRNVLRSHRIKVEMKQFKAMRELQKSALNHKAMQQQLSLIGYIGRTFQNRSGENEPNSFDLNDPEFENSKWCYDTPGVVNKTQILDLFTTEELSKVVPTKPLVPRNFRLKENSTLFIGGIARLDVLASYKPCWFTVYCSMDLPVTVTQTDVADDVYESMLGSKFFAVPCGSKERLDKWPKLMHKEFTIDGKYQSVGAADIVLSSAGWISITPSPAMYCTVRAWTPDMRGIFLRRPSLIKKSCLYRGPRIKNTPAFSKSIEVVDGYEFGK